MENIEKKKSSRVIEEKKWKDIFQEKFGWLDQDNETKTINYSDKVLGRMAQHESDQGALFCEVTGAPGSGKTGALLSCMERTLGNFKKEKVFFSECYNTPLQITKLGEGKYHLMIESEDIQFFDRCKRGVRIYPEVTMFSDFEDCYKKAKLGIVNVVFFKDRKKIIDFIGYLRTTCEWNHVFIDEMAECAPAYASGEDWKKIEEFAKILKDVRKTWINVFCSTQSVSDVDSRVRSKIQMRVLLPGSVRDKHSRITQLALDNLKEDKIKGNEGYVEYFGKFCKTRFNKIYTPTETMIDARIVEKPIEVTEDAQL